MQPPAIMCLACPRIEAGKRADTTFTGTKVSYPAVRGIEPSSYLG